MTVLIEAAAVWIVVLYFTVMGFHGRALPEVEKRAFASEADCKRDGIPGVRRSAASFPVAPDKIVCEKMEIKR